MFTPKQLRQIMRYCSEATAREYATPINDAQTAFGIDQTNARQAAFIAQVAQESGELCYACEIASGAEYEGRADLGNTKPGDGKRFKGRGLLQVTGRTNYEACSLALYGDYRLLSDPTLLEEPHDGAQAAGWYWQSHSLSPIADAGDFVLLTKKINGGLNGYAQRVVYWERAKQVLGVA